MLREDARVELIDGEILHMSPIGSRHSAVVSRLNRHFQRLGDRALVWVQSGVRVDEFGEPQPDVALLKPREDDYEGRGPRAEDVLLLVEVGDSSLTYDLNRKRKYYAEHQVRELWVVDAMRKVIHVCRDLRDGDYQNVSQMSGDQELAPQAFADYVATVRTMIE